MRAVSRPWATGSNRTFLDEGARPRNPGASGSPIDGVTLLELMIAVAIVGILGAVAVFMYTRQIRSAKASEVAAVFAEFQSRQEQYYVEQGRYLSTGDGDSDIWPATAINPGQPTNIAPLPETWSELGVKLGRTALYCGYVGMAGRAGESTGTVAQSFGMPNEPQADWYYLIAECDFDGDPENSLYFTSSISPSIASRDPGR